MIIPKAEMFRFATEDTWIYLQNKDKDISERFLYQSYEKILKWAEIKKKICTELKPNFKIDVSLTTAHT